MKVRFLDRGRHTPDRVHPEDAAEQLQRTFTGVALALHRDLDGRPTTNLRIVLLRDLTLGSRTFSRGTNMSRNASRAAR